MTSEMETAIKAVKILFDAGFEAVFAGGCVRDMLLGKEPNDIDIATSARPEQVEQIFASKATVIPVGKQFGVIRVILDGHEFEIATFREDSKESDGRRPNSVSFSSMEADASRRDLTINGMFYNPLSEELFDFVGGQEDLKNKRIRFIGSPDERIQEDALRMLRAVRFACRFDSQLDEETLRAIISNRKDVQKLSSERVADELTKILKLHHPERAIELLMQTGLLQIILPEVSDLKNVEQSPPFHTEGNALTHTIMVLQQLPKDASVELLWAALLHDVGKKDTAKQRDKKGELKWTFYGHEDVGAEKAKEILERFRFSNAMIIRTCALVKNHMRTLQIQSMNRANLRLFMSEPFFDELVQLSKADDLGRKDSSGKSSDLSWVQYIQDKKQEFEKNPLRPKPFIGGDDLKALGIKPGPIFSIILKAVYMMQLEGDISSKEEAIEIIKSRDDWEE